MCKLWEVFNVRDGRTVALVATENEARAICTRGGALWDYEKREENHA